MTYFLDSFDLTSDSLSCSSGVWQPQQYWHLKRTPICTALYYELQGAHVWHAGFTL